MIYCNATAFLGDFTPREVHKTKGRKRHFGEYNKNDRTKFHVCFYPINVILNVNFFLDFLCWEAWPCELASGF